MPSATHRSDCRRRLASSPPAQSWGGWWTAAVVALAVAVLLVPQLPADDTNDDTVFLPHDRAASQRLIKARELLADRRYSEAVRLLSAILDAPEDVFITRSKDEGAAA